MKESMSNLDKNLTDFIIKNNELNHWSITDMNKLREPPKNYFSQYLHDEQSDITYYLDLINSKYHNTKLKLKILFLQFPPYLHQVEENRLSRIYQKSSPKLRYTFASL